MLSEDLNILVMILFLRISLRDDLLRKQIKFLEFFLLHISRVYNKLLHVK